MSSDELHIGKLIKVDLKGKTKEEYFDDLLKEKGIERNDIYDTAFSQYSDEFYNEFVEIGDDIYTHVEHKYVIDEPYFEYMKQNEDGSLSYTCLFYNGGCCLKELLEELIPKTLKSETKIYSTL